MTIVAFSLGLALPAAVGWLALRALEGSAPVLTRWERIAAATVLGPTLSMFIVFLASTAGMPLTRLTFLLVFITLIACLVGWCAARTKTCGWNSLHFMRNRVDLHPNPDPNPNPNPYSPLLWAVIPLGLWVILKVAAAAFLLVSSPPYHDDVINNWNFRGKVFFVAQEFTLELQRGYGVVDTDLISSYPPAVPFMKTWLATLNGTWNEGLVNSIHIVWYCCALALLFFALRRVTTLAWSLLGTYLLSSIPLYLMHGTVAYADLPLSLHVFLVITMLFHALRDEDEQRGASYFRISALALALLPFIKNEGLLVYFPALALAAAGTLLLLRQRERSFRSAALWFIGLSTAVLIPWLAFKWFHDLPFGNAKAVSGFEFGWQPGVLRAIAINTFLEGNWLLLMPLFLGLLLLQWRPLLRSPLLLPTLFVLVVWLGQILIFLFTSISNEAINQTGYARGLVQVLPVIVMVTAILLQDMWKRILSHLEVRQEGA